VNARRRERRAAHAERGQAERAEDEDVVQDDVDRVHHEPERERRPRVAGGPERRRDDEPHRAAGIASITTA
jgi:hypothetical protein